VRDIVLKYPIWQEPYRAAVIEINPKLLKLKIAAAEQAVILRLKQLENSADHHHELTALTDALSALKTSQKQLGLSKMKPQRSASPGMNEFKVGDRVKIQLTGGSRRRNQGRSKDH
jgi:hypothetical protein